MCLLWLAGWLAYILPMNLIVRSVVPANCDTSTLTYQCTLIYARYHYVHATTLCTLPELLLGYICAVLHSSPHGILAQLQMCMTNSWILKC